MFKKLLFCILFGPFIINSYAQDFNYDHVKPSVQKILSNDFFPVSHFSGKANVKIPIYVIDEDVLNFPVELHYSTGGIRPQEPNGAYGLGWSLSAGLISREIFSHPDETLAWPSDNIPFPSEDFLKNFSTTHPNYPNYYSLNHYQYYLNNIKNKEFHPDIFSYSVNGISGQFIFKKNDFNSCMFLDHSDYKISVELDYPNINKIFLIDDKGVKYTFGQGAHLDDKFYAINTWVLTKIEDLNNPSNFIEISYVYGPYEYYTTVNETYIIDDYFDRFTIQREAEFPLEAGFEYELPRFDQIVQQKNNSRQICISKIKYQNGEIKFEYSQGNKQLLKAIVKNTAGESIREIDFFITSNILTSEKHPEFLKEVRYRDQVVGNHVYKFGFDYIDESSTMMFADLNQVDYWGYYNGQGYDGNSIPEISFLVNKFGYQNYVAEIGGGRRQANSENAKSYLLERVYYPTGGFLEFDYESNKFSKPSPIVYPENIVGGLRIKGMKIYSDINNLISEKEFKYFDEEMDVHPIHDYYYYSQLVYCINNRWLWDNARRTFFSNSPFINLAPHGSPVVYKKVEEKHIDYINSSSSRITEFFYDYNPISYSPINFEQIGSTSQGRMGPKDIFNKFSRKTYTPNNDGRLVASNSYDINYSPIKSTEYYYDEIELEQFKGSDFFENVILTPDPQPYEPFNNMGYYVGDLLRHFHNDADPNLLPWSFNDITYKSINKRIIGEQEKIYVDGGSYFKNNKEYLYLNNFSTNPASIQTHNSKGEVLVEEYYYTNSLEDGPFKNHLINQLNWIGVVFEKKNFKIKNNVSFQTYQKNIDYDMFNNSIVKVKKITESFNGDEANEIVEFLDYDLLGRPLVMKDKSGIFTQFVWSSKNYKPNAIIKSSSIDNYLLYQFEDFTNVDGNFILDYSNKNSGKSSLKIEGNNSITLSPYKSLNFSSNNLFLVSFFSKIFSNGLTIKIFTKNSSSQNFVLHSTQSLEPNSNWTNHSFEFILPPNLDEIRFEIQSSGNGTCWLDDFLFFESNSLVSTYTLNDFGKLSSEISNSTVFNYFYDGFDRLIMIRDNLGNVLKRICYSYDGMPADCQLYYNSVQNQNFTRNNCQSGLTGNQVLYSVPSGTYSAFSQAEADQLALNDIAANGQAYANANGTCSQLFSSAAISDYFYNASCSNPEPYYVTIPAGQFTSIYSQSDADNLAYQEAQNLANNYGSCIQDAPFYGSNSTSQFDFFIELYDLYNHNNYYFYIGTNVSNQFLGNVLEGYYQVQIHPVTEEGYYNVSIPCYGNYNSVFGSLMIFNAVPINYSCNTFFFY